VQTLKVSLDDEHCKITDNRIQFSVDLSPAQLQLHQEIWFFITANVGQDQPVAVPAAGELHAPAYTSANANPLWFA